MAVEIFKLFGSIFVNNDEANKSISKTDSKAKGVAETLGKGIKTAAKWSAAIVGGASAAVGGMMKMATSSASTADHIDKMSQKIGISRKAYQELDFICSQSGTSVDNLGKGMKSLRSAMSNDKNAEVFKSLGVAITDANGKMRDSESVMWDAMSALQGVANADEKAALAQKLFGKSGQELMPLLNGQAGSIDEMKKKAHEMGLVMSDELVDSGVGLTDSLDKLKRGFSAIITKIGGAFMPIFQKVTDKLQGALPFIQNAITKLEPIATSFFSNLLPPLFELGQTLFPVILGAIEQGAPLLQQLAVTLLPIIISIIQQLAPLAAQFVSSVLPALLGFLQQIAPAVGQFAQTVLPLIVQLIQILLPFLVQICNIVLPILANAINDLLPLLGEILSSILPILIEFLSKLLPIALKICEAVLPIFEQAFKAIMPLLRLLCENLLPVLLSLFELLSPVLELLAKLFSDGLGQAISSVTKILKPFFDILNGLIEFIEGVFSGNWEKVWNGIVKIFKGILNVIPSVVESVINGAIWIINKIIDGLDWAIEWTGMKIPHIPEVSLPRFRAGLDFVPNDKYLAYLDKGEAVLTAQEAEEYRQSKRENGTQSPFATGKSEAKTVNQTFNISIHIDKIKDDFDVKHLARQVVDEVSVLLAEEVSETEGVYA